MNFQFFAFRYSGSYVLGSFSFSVGTCIPPVPIHRACPDPIGGFIGERFPNPDPRFSVGGISESRLPDSDFSNKMRNNPKTE